MKNFIKIFSSLLFCIGISGQALAQNIGINSTGAAPDSSAMLDISSNDRGLLIPRMDSTSRKNIINPAKGLMVYDSTYNQFYYYDGMLWTAFVSNANRDNLGNHIASRQLQLGDHWLNNDGGANEGIAISPVGEVGIGTNPATSFHVSMGTGNPGFRINDTLLQINDYELPIADGSAGQIFSTDGAGNVSWSDVTTTDNQDLSLSGNTLSLSNDATSVDLSGYLDNTDVQDLSFSGHTLSLSNDATSVDLSGYIDNTDAQDLSLSGNTLSVTNDATTVDLSVYADNTDAQDLSLSGNTLSLTNDATTIDLSSYLDNTDAQSLSFSGGILSLSNDASSVDLNSISAVDNLGNHVATQNLQLDGNWLNNDGGATEGISISNTGQVGINTLPSATFHVDMGAGNSGFRVEDNGVTIGHYTLTTKDGTANQILTTNGSGAVSWVTPGLGGPDDLGNHTATQNLPLNGHWLSNDGGNEGIAIDNNGKVGIGRTVGSTGHAILEYHGASLSTAGPHIQFVGSNDDYPLFQQLNWTHDNISFNFDSYYDGLWRSSSANSNFQIYKLGGALYRHYSSGIAPGGVITSWSIGTVLDASGRFGIGRVPTTNRLEVDGTASKSTAGNWLANSDARLKKNISPLSSEEMLDKLLTLQGVTYEWNDNKTGNQRPEGIQYGFTAQNIQEVFPSLVSEDNQGYLQTAYGTYDAMTVEAIRALHEKIEQLEAGSASLQSKTQRLQNKSQDLDTHSAELAELKAFYAELETMVDKKISPPNSTLESEQ